MLWGSGKHSWGFPQIYTLPNRISAGQTKHHRKYELEYECVGTWLQADRDKNDEAKHVMQREELIFELTCEATKPEGPQALIGLSVIQHSQSIAGIVQLAASYDPKIVQRHQAHRDMCNEYITLHLSDLLVRERQKTKQNKKVQIQKQRRIKTQ